MANHFLLEYNKYSNLKKDNEDDENVDVYDDTDCVMTMMMTTTDDDDDAAAAAAAADDDDARYEQK